MRCNYVNSVWQLLFHWRLVPAAARTRRVPGSEPGLDGEHDSFGVGKADGPGGGYDACVLRESLHAVNDGTSLDFLTQDVKLHSRAAKKVLEHRLGPDGACGTADDNIFDDLAELDEVPWVGRKALAALAAYVEPLCTLDLSTGRPYIDKKTWDGQPATGWSRDAIEMEATLTVKGATGAELRAALKNTDNRGRTGFRRATRAKVMEAFAFGYALDEIPWNRSAHEARESMPYMSYSIEPGNFDPDPNDGERELDTGTDIMDDIYYDTKDYDLLDNGMQVRGRLRWDDETTIRRLLIAAKFNSETDEFGIKRAGKIDIRQDSPSADAVRTLEDDVRWGKVAWNQGMPPLKAVYEKLGELDKLKENDGKTGVMALDSKVYLRSIRARYHLNMTSNAKMRQVYDNGKTRATLAQTIVQAAIDSGKLNATQTTAAQGVLTQIAKVLDDSAVFEKAKTSLDQITGGSVSQSDVVFVASFLDASNAPSSTNELATRKAVADAANAVYHELGTTIDDLDRVVTFTDGLDHEDFVDMFIQWQHSLNPALRIKTTADVHRDAYLAIDALSATERAAKWAEFNTFAEQQKNDGNNDFNDYVPMTDVIWSALGHHFDYEVLRTSQRMIEAAGTTSQAIYFEVAREYFIPSSSRPSGNFIIDTMDFTEMLTPAAWKSIPVDQRTAGSELPACKVFHSMFVNEVQIELTTISQFTDRIEELKKALDAAGGSDASIKENLDGAQWVLKQMVDSMTTIGQLKGPDIIDTLEDFGAPNSLEWVPSEDSKGNTALKIITDTD